MEQSLSPRQCLSATSGQCWRLLLRTPLACSCCLLPLIVLLLLLISQNPSVGQLWTVLDLAPAGQQRTGQQRTGPDLATPGQQRTGPVLATPGQQLTGPDLATPGQQRTGPVLATPGQQRTGPDLATAGQQRTGPDLATAGQQRTGPDLATPGQQRTGLDLATPGQQRTGPDLATPGQQRTGPDLGTLLRRRPSRARPVPERPPRQLKTPPSAALRHLLLSDVMRSRYGSTDMELARPDRLRRPAACPQRAVVPWTGGRTGNLLFEYLSAWAISRLHNATLLLPDTIIEEFEGVFAGMTGQRGDRDFLLMDCAHLWHQRRNISLEDIDNVWTDLAPISGWLELVGFPNNMTRSMYQLWFAYEAEIHDELRFSAPISGIIQEYMWRVRRALAPAGEEVTFIGVHARRADYHEAIFNMRGVWMTEPGELYFSRGVRHYQRRYPNVVFLVVSDDMEWCRRHLAGLDAAAVLFPGDAANPAILDMALLAHCNHTLITYGTFALSAAILSGGDVVVAADTGTKWDEFEGVKEFWPAEWTEISVL